MSVKEFPLLYEYNRNVQRLAIKIESTYYANLLSSRFRIALHNFPVIDNINSGLQVMSRINNYFKLMLLC